ncbi:DUF7455 domain-containing protein [Pseudarthrobacter chlorophenolicus]|nr:hypothetical protein [Pseudarthrobacter chlorophenolicus]
MTTDTLTKPLTRLAVELNTHLETQAPERTLSLLDRCDRCSQLAQSSFVFKIEACAEGSGRTETDVLLCGHHARIHLPALLAKTPVSYWIEPQELLSIRGVKVQAASDAKAGDGLTDASR